MKGTTKFIWTIMVLMVLVSWGFSYVFSYAKSKDELYLQVDSLFQEHAVNWGDYIMQAKGIPYSGFYDSQEYAKKMKTTIFSIDDTIEISKAFFHPESYYEYQMKGRETFLIMSGVYDIELIDSLFNNLLTKHGITAESSVELRIKDLRQMFPRVDSMCSDVPFTKFLTTGSVKGHLTPPIGVGICDHAQLYGHLEIPFSVVLSKIDWLGLPQVFVLLLFVILLIIKHYLIRYAPIYSQFKKNVMFIGNTCIDLPSQELFVWNGECKHITGTKMQLMQMLIDAAPTYELLKDDVCRKIWNRNSRDGQALYNVAMTELRKLFITDDPSLELKSLPREGMQLLVNGTLINKRRCIHFLSIYLKYNSRKYTKNDE